MTANEYGKSHVFIIIRSLNSVRCVADAQAMYEAVEKFMSTSSMSRICFTNFTV